MNVLLAHNYYQQAGGEDAVVAAEFRLLRAMGHDAHVLLADNDGIKGFGAKFRAALGVMYSRENYIRCRARIAQTKADLLHVHNFFPVLSPSLFYAARDAKVPSLMTLHNFRTICPTVTLTHRDEVCERSLEEGPWWAVKERVYKDSLAGTMALASMIQIHRSLGTWRDVVSGFIALTEFSRNTFIKAGFPADRIHVKPNFIFDPQPSLGPQRTPGDYALFVGRLSPEKGVSQLLQAWESVDFPLYVAGDGPLRDMVATCRNPRVHFLGQQSAEQVKALMASASFLLMPSLWYEGFPMTLLEAYATALPVVASRLGSLAELVEDGVTGALVDAGDVEALVTTCNTLMASKETLRSMSEAARERYRTMYTPEANARRMGEIYDLIRSSGTGS